MGKFNAAKMSGAADVAFQNNYNYLIDLLDSGYMTEAIVNGHRIRIDLNSQIGLNGTNNNVQMFGLDPNTGNFFLKSTLLSGDIVVGGSGDIGSITVLDETDTPIITMDETGLSVEGIVRALGFRNSTNPYMDIKLNLFIGESNDGHITADYDSEERRIFEIYRNNWSTPYAGGDIHIDLPTNGFFYLSHTGEAGYGPYGQLTFGHDGYFANPYINSSVQFKVPTPTTTTSATTKAYVDGLWTYADWTPTDASGAKLTFTYTRQAKYSKAGKIVTAYFDVTYPSTSATNYAKVSLPFTADGYYTGAIGYNTYGAALTFDGGNFYTIAGAALTNADLSGKRMIVSATYRATT